MKIVSPDILHKTEAGGVVLNVQSAAEAERAYEKIVAGARAYKPDAKFAGVEIQQMLSGGQEVIVGATADPSFGKVVAFGLGRRAGRSAQGHHVSPRAGEPRATRSR